jgi:hypothetical protein
MKKNTIIIIGLLVLTNLIALIGWSNANRKITMYHTYYKATENLLDTLDNHYDWVDAFDPYDYYEASWGIREITEK